MSDSGSVWSQMQSSLARCRAAFSSNQTISDGLGKFALKLVTPAAEKIGWDFEQEEDYLTVQLRKLLLGMAAGAGHER
jgi:ERAP1-like C-terminal domain